MKKRFSRVYLELTNICNKSCSFCPRTTREPRTMTMDEVACVFDRLSGYTDYIYFHLMGEPMTNRSLADAIRLGSERGFKCAVTTNGTLLSKWGRELIDAGVYKVNISLHSFEGADAKEHTAYIKECLDFADEASRAGVLTVLRLWERGASVEHPDPLPTVREYFSGEEWVRGERGYRIRHRLHLEYGERFAWPSLSADELGERVFCYGLTDHIGILSDGSVVPCCLDGEGVITLGNIFSSELTDILSSERAENILAGFRAREAREELCRRCGYARRFKI